METFSLFELNEHLRRVIALNFEDALWVRCEISQARPSRGHYYLELIEKMDQGDAIKAKSSAIIWSKNLSFLRRKFGDVVSNILQEGVEVRIKVRIDFNERYGLKLMIEDLDPSFTLGNLELQRRETLEKLTHENLIQKNATIPIAAVVQRIAVLSSDNAAGYQDFLHQLHENSYGYHYEVELFSVAVQGQRVEKDISDALHQISKVAKHYDCVVLIRGGGSRIDLSGFDSYLIGRAIALCPIPVFTGIGHEIDQSVADLVAHTALKTPTAVADLLIEVNLQFDATIADLFNKITLGARTKLERASSQLVHATERLKMIPLQKLNTQYAKLAQIGPHIHQLARMRIAHFLQKLEHAGSLTDVLDPMRVLKRGFSMTMKDGSLVTDATQLESDDIIETQLASGHIKSRVTNG